MQLAFHTPTPTSFTHTLSALASDALDEAPLYTVSLQDYPDLPDAERERAQRRYARALERKLGGAQAVYDILSVLQNLEDAPPDDLAPEQVAELQALYRRWQQATRAALEAGLQGLGGAEACFFEVQLHHR